MLPFHHLPKLYIGFKGFIMLKINLSEHVKGFFISKIHLSEHEIRVYHFKVSLMGIWKRVRLVLIQRFVNEGSLIRKLQ